jgi:hypothetical protein
MSKWHRSKNLSSKSRQKRKNLNQNKTSSTRQNHNLVVDLSLPHRLSLLLQDFVEHGTRVFNLCWDASQGLDSEDAALLFLYRHILEMIDTIEVLASQSCAEGILLPLRSAFEAFLSMEYIVKVNYKERALAWLIRDAHNEIKSLNRLLSTSL